MYHTVWKLTALAAVVGIGVAVVVHAQRGMQDDGEAAAMQQTAGDETNDANSATPSDSDEAGLPAQGEPDLFATDESGVKAAPASAKTPGIVKASGVRDLNDPQISSKLNARSRSAAGSDPFEMSDDESASDAAPPRKATKAQAASSRGAIDIVDVADENDLDEPEQVQVAAKQNKSQHRARGPVQTLDEPDAVDSGRSDSETDDGSTGESGPRLLRATDDMDADSPPATSSRPPAARIDTDDPFADEDSADSRNVPSKTPAGGDESDASVDDEAEAAPAKPAIDSNTRQFKRDLVPLDLDEQEFTGRDDARTPATTQPAAVNVGQSPAELSSTIETEDAAANEACRRRHSPSFHKSRSKKLPRRLPFWGDR